ncbi:hypothetical protein FQA39_LY07255 [Lamprigera yunnana]|nr:hypothetical protein FQA39_LY07255 [Lamprigera yunnana]
MEHGKKSIQKGRIKQEWNKYKKKIRRLNVKEEEIIEEMKPQKLSYLGTTETKKKSKEVKELREGCMSLWSGVENADHAAGEVGPDKIKNIKKEKYVNKRLQTIEINWEGRQNSRVSNNATVHAPTSSGAVKFSFWEY